MRGAIITGASRGIGFAVAEYLLVEGYKVFIGARDVDLLAVAAEELAARFGRDAVGFNKLDVRETTSVEHFFAAARTRSSSFNVLVNNAGIGGGGHTLALGEQHWLDMFQVNVHGTFRCTMAFLADRDPAAEARIINIASTGGKQGVVHAAAYTATKHAVVGFTKSLGLELAKTGVTVNAVCPGFVETDLAVGARERYAAINNVTPIEMKQRIEARIPIGRYVMPEEVARAVSFLASPGSSAITAQTLNVCGGLGNY